MSDKQWQVDVYTNSGQETPHTFYDASLVALREQVYAWLVENKPVYLRSEDVRKKGGPNWQPYQLDHHIYRIFCDSSLSIQRGPEYEDRGFIDGKFQLAYVRQVARREYEHEANPMFQRGWVLLAVETSEETGSAYVLGHVEQDAF